MELVLVQYSVTVIVLCCNSFIPFWTKICNVQRMEIAVTDREDSRCFGNGQVASRPSRLVHDEGEVHGRRRRREEMGMLPHLNFTFPR